MPYQPISKTNLPIAFPKNQLQPAVLPNLNNFIPRRIGSDGYIYGTQGNFIGYSSDGCATFTIGTFDFSVDGYGQPVIAIKTISGYIVITQDATPTKGALYFSTTFNSGYTRKFAFTTASWSNNWNCDFYLGNDLGRDTICLVGEYGYLNTQRNLYASFDGGITWATIASSRLLDASTVNSHIHTACYDPYHGRIYVSCGDGLNRWLRYSDDMGTTWIEIQGPVDSIMPGALQPTYLGVMPEKMIMGVDQGNYSLVLLSLISKGFLSVGSETFDVNTELPINSSFMVYHSYAKAPAAFGGGEIYLLLPNEYGDKKHIIVASGDSGNTWHTVYTLNSQRDGATLPFYDGLIGLDTNGYFYVGYQQADGSKKILKFGKINWLYK